MGLSHEDYARLLTLRNGLRRFLRWSEQQAERAGLTPNQHQLLLAIHGHDDPRGPTVGEVADYLLLRHHSTVELIDRADTAGLVTRQRDPDDHRVVRLSLTSDGAERLETLSAMHLEELDRLSLQLPAAWKGLSPIQPTHGLPDARPHNAAADLRLAPDKPSNVSTRWPISISWSVSPLPKTSSAPERLCSEMRLQ